MTTRQPHPQPNPDMNYSALERLDIKFSELIGAIEEKQVDGQLSSKDHGDYELVCYCRGFIKAELEKERRTSHSSQPAPLNENTSIPTQNEFIAEFVGMEEKKRRERDAQVAKAERERVLDTLLSRLAITLGTGYAEDEKLWYEIEHMAESLRGGEQQR